MARSDGNNSGQASGIAGGIGVNAPADLQTESMDGLRREAASLIRQLQNIQCASCETTHAIQALSNDQNPQDLRLAIAAAYDVVPKAEAQDKIKNAQDAERIQHVGMSLAGSLAGIISLNTGKAMDAGIMLGALTSPFAPQDSPQDPAISAERNGQYVRNRVANPLQDLFS